MAFIFGYPSFRATDDNGQPLVGGQLFTYEAGTSTPLATFSSQDESGVNTNPVILDSKGEAKVWLGSQAYKFVLKDANDVVIDTWDVLKQDIQTAMLADGSVTTEKLAAAAVTQEKIGLWAIGEDEIEPDSINQGHIKDGFLTADSVGRAKMVDGFITTPKIGANQVTRAKLESVGQQVSAGSGGFTTMSTTPVPVTNLSVTITTTGRPIIVMVCENSANSAWIMSRTTPGAHVEGYIVLNRNGATVFRMPNAVSEANPSTDVVSIHAPGFVKFDPQPAGTYTYTVSALCGAAGQSLIYRDVNLIAFEL